MAGSGESAEKVTWSGRVMAIQPRIRLMRSFDERSYSYLGYGLCIDGICGGEVGEFVIAVGEGAHDKHRFQAGMEIKGRSVSADDPRKETAAFCNTSGIKVVKDAESETPAGPPFHGVPLTWKHTGLADTAVWTPGPTTPNARLVSGAAGCRWK